MAATDITSAKIFIATPCYAGVCHAAYSLSLVKTFTAFLKTPHIQITHKFIMYESLVPRARNHFAAYALADPSITHLLFIDADMRWEPRDILRLLNAKKPIIAATFPKKRYVWDRLHNPLIQEVINNDQLAPAEFSEKIRANLVEYALNFGPGREVKDGIIEVDHLATAFMLIERQTLEAMVAAFPERKVRNPSSELPKAVGEHLYGLFDLNVIDGEYLSEDYSFCNLWHKLDGKVYADLTINLAHYGNEEFDGNFMAVGNVKQGPL